MKSIVFIAIIVIVGLTWFLFLLKSGILRNLKTSQQSVGLIIAQSEITKYIDVDTDLDLKYEEVDDTKYFPRRFIEGLESEYPFSGKKLIMGRGSWRATQGNIYSYAMFKRDLKDEFDEQL